jgi:hypothetical protein
MFLRANLHEPVPLQALVSDGRTDLFVRVTILDAAYQIVTALNAPHIMRGLYAVNWTPNIEGYFTTLYEFFLNSACTAVANDYPRGGETIEVSSEKANILRLLGLNHENSVLDQQVFDSGRRLLSARLRSYNSKDNAIAATSTGLLFEWNVHTAYDSQNKATLFRIDRIT